MVLRFDEVLSIKASKQSLADTVEHVKQLVKEKLDEAGERMDEVCFQNE